MSSTDAGDDGSHASPSPGQRLATVLRIDHIVLTVADVERSAAFYERVLGLQRIRFAAGRTALRVGDQKINLQQVDTPSPPVASSALPGSADFCLVTGEDPAEILATLARHDIPVLEGPVEKVGALGPVSSVYFRDPDGNLVEVARYHSDRKGGPMGIEFRVEEATAILGRTPGVLAELLEGLPERWLHANEGEDTFSPYEVVGHLIHGERTDWLPRLRIVAVEGEGRPFESFDRFAHRDQGRERPIEEMLKKFARLRQESLASLEDLLEGGLALSAVGTHPELGRVTAGELIAAWAVHDLGHLRQIARTLAGQYRNWVGPLRAYLPVLDEGED